jgi:hypothetical protein
MAQAQKEFRFLDTYPVIADHDMLNDLIAEKTQEVLEFIETSADIAKKATTYAVPVMIQVLNHLGYIEQLNANFAASVAATAADHAGDDKKPTAKK